LAGCAIWHDEAAWQDASDSEGWKDSLRENHPGKGFGTMTTLLEGSVKDRERRKSPTVAE
jgi:hypothetical protein